MAAAAPRSDGRVTDWLVELERLTTTAASFSPSARAAVIAVVDAFEAEDGILPDAAQRARTVLATIAVAPEASSTYPSVAHALRDALKIRWQGEQSTRPVPTAA